MSDGSGLRLTETGRVEAFSDAVFAIALTLLVLDLHVPAAGRFPYELRHEWATYLAYLVAFLTIGSIWLSHHNAFTRIRRADAPLLVTNLVLLLGASLVPWPTSLIATSLRSGDRHDEVAAISVYALVTVLVGIPWTVMSARLARLPQLLEDPAGDTTWMRRHGRMSFGTVAVAVVAVAVSFAAPLVSLLLYVVVPLGFIVSSCRPDARS